MTADNRTTKEQRQAKIDSAISNLEKPATPQEPDKQAPTEETDVPALPAKDPAKEEPKEPSPQEPNKQEPVIPTKKEDPAPAPVEPKTPPIQERYKASTQEVQVYHEQFKRVISSFEQADQLPEPTEDELKREYPEWEEMTATEKRLAKESLTYKKRNEHISGAVKDSRQLETWVEKVDSFITTDLHNYPKLTGKEDAFKAFCVKPTRRGLEFPDLVKLFLYDHDEDVANRKKENKGSLLEPGSAGGPESKPKEQTIGAEEARKLRTTDHKLYEKYVKEGKIVIKI